MRPAKAELFETMTKSGIMQCLLAPLNASNHLGLRVQIDELDPCVQYRPYTAQSLMSCLENEGYQVASTLLRECDFPEAARIAFVTAEHYESVRQALSECKELQGKVLKYLRGSHERSLAFGELTRHEANHAQFLYKAFCKELEK